MVSFPFALLAVTLGESGPADQTDAFAVVVGYNKIDPFLAFVDAVQTGEDMSIPLCDWTWLPSLFLAACSISWLPQTCRIAQWFYLRKSNAMNERGD